MKKITKKDKILIGVTATILLSAVIFVITFWEPTITLIEQMLSGVDLVQEYIKSLGIIGIVVMILIIIGCFFLPIISSMPVQIACGIAYGLFGGGFIVLFALTIASQLLFLFRQNLKVFYSKKHVEKRQELEQRIKDSNRSIIPALIIAYLLPGIPFLVISNLAATGLKYWKYTLITVLGSIPDVVITLFLGEKLLASSPVASIITLFVIITIIIFSMIFNDKLVNWAFRPRKQKNEEE